MVEVNSLGRRLVGLLLLIGAAAGVYTYLIDDDTKAILKRTALGITDTAQAIAGRLADEMGQIVDDDPELNTLRESIASDWARLGY